MHTKEKAGQTCTGNNYNSKVQNNLPYRKSDAIKLLEAMANEAARRKNPNIPVEWLAPRKYRDDSANGITRCIIDYIRLTGGQAERINNTGRMIDTRKTFEDVTGRTRTNGSSKWIPGTGNKGTADVAATIKGHSVKIEVKYGPDRQSEAQRAYQRQVEQAGGIYVIASSFEQFYHWFSEKFANNAS